MTMLFQNYFTKTSLEALNSIAPNGSRLGEVVDFEKLSLKFITNVK